MTLVFSWWARLDLAQPRKKRGKKAQGVFFRAVEREDTRRSADEEVALIRRHAETMAYMVVEMYLEHRRTSQ